MVCKINITRNGSAIILYLTNAPETGVMVPIMMKLRSTKDKQNIMKLTSIFTCILFLYKSIDARKINVKNKMFSKAAGSCIKQCLT